MTDRENRFLEALGITPGPWELGELTKQHRIPDGLVIVQYSAMFLALFKIAQYCMDLDPVYTENEIFSMASNQCEAATGKTLAELCRLWEGTA